MDRRRVFLPADICNEEGVSDDDILQVKTKAGISNVAFKVATQAKVRALPRRRCHPCGASFTQKQRAGMRRAIWMKLAQCQPRCQHMRGR